MPKLTPSVSYRISPRWTAPEARAALRAFASSGLSQSAFCRREGLDPQRLRAWQRKLGSSREPATFVEIAPRLAERVEVVLPSGVVVRVSESVDAAALRRIVDALESRAPC